MHGSTNIKFRHKKFGVDISHRYTYTLQTKHSKSRIRNMLAVQAEIQ
jgi:hypothetical protein